MYEDMNEQEGKLKMNPYLSRKENTSKVKNEEIPKTILTQQNEVLKLIDTTKFIQQNNFIPVPMQNKSNAKMAVSQMPNYFYPSGENMVHHKINL